MKHQVPHSTNSKQRSTLKGKIREIAKMAVTTGVIIKTDGTFIPLCKEGQLPDLAMLQKAVEGLIEVVNIPSKEPAKAPTILIVNEEGLLCNLPDNPTVSSIVGKPLVGDVIWMPREWLK